MYVCSQIYCILKEISFLEVKNKSKSYDALSFGGVVVKVLGFIPT